MDFTAPSFSIGIDFDDPPPAPAPAAAGSDQRGQARGYAAPDPPSFSLGLDFEDDGGDEPRLPAGGRREGLARGYEAPDAPSFSLGFDDDDEDDDGGADVPEFPAGGRQEEQARRYEAPDPPSFSLGFDDDDGGGAGEPHLPAGSRREKQPLRYEAPDAPSFSLGFDDDDDDDFVADGRPHEQPRPQVAPGHLSFLDDEDDEFLLAGSRQPDQARGEALHPDPVPVQPGMARLKRLRRGPAPRPMAPPPPSAPAPLATEASPGTAAWGDIGSIEDEIEVSTDEELPRGMPASVGSCRTSSNSKFSLLSQSVLTTQSTRKTKITKFTPSSSSVVSKPLEESCTKKLLPKITISPLRKIHFLDSDTDSDDNKSRNKAKKPASPIKKRQESMDKYVQKKHTLQQNGKSGGSSVAQKNKDNMKDSWATPALDDFCSDYVQKTHTLPQNSKSEGSSVVQKNKDNMTDSWATPALDDFCSEYFKSVQDSRPSQQKEVNSFSGSKVPKPYTSASEIGGHFQHESSSSRVVLEENLTDSHPPAMHYFFHHDQMVQNLVRERLQHFVPIGAETSQGNEYRVEENLNYRNQFGQSGDANGRWVTPNKTTSFPTDFGKRRVHAGGTQSGSGHWFTGEDGRKVYVSKNGQELSGRDAYRQYKKESGKGFRKFKKKSAVKKEGSAGARRGSSTANKASSSAKRSSAAKRKR